MTIRPTPPKITLDHVRPTVVRRRVYEVSPQNSASPANGAPSADDLEDEDNGPPSSVNVARALASLRGHELKRLDEILTRDDEIPLPPPRAAAPAPAPAAPAVPTVRVGPSIALTELARRMDVAQEELVTALVTRGFFSITVKATLPRDTARAAAAMFGFEVEETDEEPTPETKPKAKAKPNLRTKALAAKPKSKLATKSKLALKSKAKAKPNARSSSPRRTSRRP